MVLNKIQLVSSGEVHFSDGRWGSYCIYWNMQDQPFCYREIKFGARYRKMVRVYLTQCDYCFREI